ncbi:hypothetical protein VV869_10305 [Photobacterium sp. MCCC 1A19761]|uniref:PilW family protein n=1 Tax=Photobacterium sp. MCCC 1A19761 TaxID=3115000 RepID=UPI00307EEAEE
MTPVKRARGMTLIELVVATALGVPVLLMLTTAFASGSKSASRINEELYVYTEFHELSQLITGDLRRAGYSLEGQRAGDVKWPGVADPVSVNSAKDCIAYAYEFEDSGPQRRYTTIYRDTESPGVINYYTKQLSIGAPLPAGAAPCQGGETVIDSHLITVTELQFDVSGYPSITATLGIQSRDGVYQTSSTFNVIAVN